jgi:hypothetical protein
MASQVLGPTSSTRKVAKRVAAVPFQSRELCFARALTLGPLAPFRMKSVIRRVAASDAATGIFPAGKRQAKVKIPALWIKTSVSDASGAAFDQDLDNAIESGATAVVLSDKQAGGADLFNAAAHVKEVVRGRAVVLIEDRTDIATACQLDGVMLTPQGTSIACIPHLRNRFENGPGSHHQWRLGSFFVKSTF